jgi:hypothetical protein
MDFLIDLIALKTPDFLCFALVTTPKAPCNFRESEIIYTHSKSVQECIIVSNFALSASNEIACANFYILILLNNSA